MATTICHLLLRGLDGRTSCLRFPSSTVTGSLIQQQIVSALHLPAEALLILTGTTLVLPHTALSAGSDGFFPSCTLSVRLPGGKGGFGSLLRGAGTKAGQKKTSNFDACRDMSGRRLRHVNAEKKLKEWKAQANERELEKAANEFLKKQVKRKENDSGCSQVIEKFREDTSKAREDVESAVARGLAEAKRLGKRKVVEDDTLPASSSKRAHMWFDNEINMDEDDVGDEKDGSSDDESEDEEGSGGEDAKEGSNHAEAEECFEAEENSEDGKAEEVFECTKAGGSETRFKLENIDVCLGDVEAERQYECGKVEEKVAEDHCLMQFVKCDASSSSVFVQSLPELQQSEGKNELGTSLPVSVENGLGGVANDTSLGKELIIQENLNFDNFHHASDLEVLGLERLKIELQRRGLKCGGSLVERAGRLFLLKTCPLEKLDKKHFAKAKA